MINLIKTLILSNIVILLPVEAPLKLRFRQLVAAQQGGNFSGCGKGQKHTLHALKSVLFITKSQGTAIIWILVQSSPMDGLLAFHLRQK